MPGFDAGLRDRIGIGSGEVDQRGRVRRNMDLKDELSFGVFLFHRDATVDGIRFCLRPTQILDSRGLHLDRFVLESHVVTYAPSATVLYLLRAFTPLDRPTRSSLGVGDVVYSGGTPTQSSVDTAQADDLDTAFVSLAALPNLPGSKEELVSVADIVQDGSELLLETNATESAFKSEPLQDFRMIHLAVHGIADKQFPDRAALVLGTSPASQEDGLLQVREIRGLALRADLVTLSACDTGNGRLLGQEGIASLERAFLLAGAKSVLASLWTADDIFTTALMKRFYQHLVDGQNEGTALRQAKLDLLEKFGDGALPIYWAGVTLVGEGGRLPMN